jgi:predicted DNA-binding transcriptional regulator AlpA
MPRATNNEPAASAPNGRLNGRRVPISLTAVMDRWSCSRMHVWRQRQDPRFPKVFTIGSRKYVWLDELEEYEELQAAGGEA